MQRRKFIRTAGIGTAAVAATGTLAAPKKGAASMAAPGRIIASNQSCNVASILPNANSIIASSQQQWNLVEHVAGKIGEQHHDAAAEQRQANRDKD